MPGPGRVPARLACALLALLLASPGSLDGGPAVTHRPPPGPVVTLDTSLAGLTLPELGLPGSPDPAATQSQSPTPAPTTTTTTTAPGDPPPPPPPPPPAPESTDTGLTRARIRIETAAAWTAVTLEGMEILVSKVTETAGSTRVTALGGSRIAVDGAGRAVVEAVLSVPPGSATGWAMCKNYLGPASVTFERITDSPQTVAVFTNTGTSQTAQNGCENPAHQQLARAEVMGPVRWPARRDPRRLVLAHYYPWFNDARLATDFGDNPAGPADTSDPAEVAQSVAMADGAGIDGFVIEYEGTAANNPMIDEAYRAANARPGFFSCLMLDFELLLQHRGSISAAVLDEALAAMAARAAQPSQLRMNGEPVVFVYGGARVDPGAWSAALERLRANTGLRPFVVSDHWVLSPPAYHLYSTNNVPTQAALEQWALGTLLDYRAEPGLEGQLGPLWVAPVSPGYNDYNLGRPSPTYVDRRAGARYDETWAATLRTLPEWVVVTSWNEYYEQTHVFPGTTTGDRAMQQTAFWAAQFHAAG